MKKPILKLTKDKIIAAALILILVAIGIFVKQAYILQIVILTVLYAYWGVSWNILAGYAGQFSLGHALYVGIGAYTSSMLFNYLGVSPWIGMIAGGILGGIAGFLIGELCFGLKGTYFNLATVAILTIVRMLFNSERVIFGVKTGAASGVKLQWKGDFINMQFLEKNAYLFVVIGFLIFALIVSSVIKNSKMGYYLNAIAIDQNAAASLGCNVKGYKLLAMFISAFLTAMGGTFYAQLLQYVDPNTVFAYDLSITIMMLSIIGGRGTLWGPIMGAVLLIPLQELVRGWVGASLAGISIVIYGLVTMIVVLFLPHGLISIFTEKKKKVKIKANKLDNEVASSTSDK